MGLGARRLCGPSTGLSGLIQPRDGARQPVAWSGPRDGARRPATRRGEAIEVRRCLPLCITGNGGSDGSWWRKRERNQLG